MIGQNPAIPVLIGSNSKSMAFLNERIKILKWNPVSNFFYTWALSVKKESIQCTILKELAA